jgi:protein-disulfide isomerase
MPRLPGRLIRVDPAKVANPAQIAVTGGIAIAQTERSAQVNITRRQFAIATGTLALTGVLGGLAGPHWLTPAYAQDPSPAELMKPGPLGEMVLGDDKAPVTIIEYASMTCPHCANFHRHLSGTQGVISTPARCVHPRIPPGPTRRAGFMPALLGRT